MSNVERARTPPRNGGDEQSRAVLWRLQRPPADTIHVELVAYIDAVELETFAHGRFRRCWRYLRDSEARKYADRLRARLEARGFGERRQRDRVSGSPGIRTPE